MSVKLTSEPRARRTSHRLKSLLSATAFGAVLAVAGGVVVLNGLTIAHAAGAQCSDTDDMLRKGLEAWKIGRYEMALPAFDCVMRADNGLQKFYAEFYTARILSDDTSGFTDHTKAYTLFQGLADMSDTVDPDDMRRAPFVAKSVTAVAGYVRKGLAEIGLRPDAERATEYLRHSATIFNEPDAQFELAKLHLVGQGVPQDTRLGMHYVQKLVQDSHAGAQAYLADLYWTGKHVALDRVRSLALSKLAMENASVSDRLWIEDGYQKYFCGTPTGDRNKAAETVVFFRKMFARSQNVDRAAPQLPSGWALGSRRDLGLARTCANGEPIDMDLKGAEAKGTAMMAAPAGNSLTQSVPQQTLPAGVRGVPLR